MINRFKEIIFPFIIKNMVHKKEKLTAKEQKAQNALLANLKIAKRKTKKPVIVAMIGLIGSGKSSVAKELSSLIGANVITSDEIRVLFRKEGEKYNGTQKIAENIAFEIIKQGGSVIMDSDHIDVKKRASLCKKAESARVKLVFIRTYSEDGDQSGMHGFILDTMIGRNIAGLPDEFFSGASTSWKGSVQEKGAVVKLREMMRRLPHHYRWENKSGGRWVIKNPPCKVLTDINTADSNWKAEVKKAAQKLLS